jgi:hypothetical protein
MLGFAGIAIPAHFNSRFERQSLIKQRLSESGVGMQAGRNADFYGFHNKSIILPACRFVNRVLLGEKSVLAPVVVLDGSQEFFVGTLLSGIQVLGNLDLCFSQSDQTVTNCFVGHEVQNLAGGFCVAVGYGVKCKHNYLLDGLNGAAVFIYTFYAAMHKK